MNTKMKRKNTIGKRPGLFLLCLVLMLSYASPFFNDSNIVYAQENTIKETSGEAIENPNAQEGVGSETSGGGIEDPGKDENGNPKEGTDNESSGGGLDEPEDNNGGLNGASFISAFEVDLPDTSWYIGNESDEIFYIDDMQQLMGLSLLVNEGNDFTDKTIEVETQDLYLSGTLYPLEPIGTEEHPFNGTFDGNGVQISNLRIVTELKQNVGLFGYAGPDSEIKNIYLAGGTLSVLEENEDGEIIRSVGPIAGYTEGYIENCESGMNVTIISERELGTDNGIIRDIGGIVGHTLGDIYSCKNSGTITIESNSDVNDTIRYLIGGVGGLAGRHGDVNDPINVPTIESSTNSGPINFNVTGKGGVDRFGAQLFSVSFATGGIAGESAGRIINCNNTAVINTSNGTAAEPEEGRGTDSLGGIVGNLRGKSFEETSLPNNNGNSSKEDTAYKYFVSNGGIEAPNSIPEYAAVIDSINTGTIVGLAAVGGIVGNAGTFTEIEGCVNLSDVKGCRWNKPFAAGIVGNTQGDIRYCYNKGNIFSVTGAGYYCSGIAGSLWSANSTLTLENNRAPITEMTGCYSIARIWTIAPGYKTAYLAGESEGFVHNNVYQEKSSGVPLSLDNKAIQVDNGTTKDNLACGSANELKDSIAIGTLNTYASAGGNWGISYLPDALNTNEGFPVLSRGNTSIDDAVEIPSSAVETLVSDAFYSASAPPKPKIKIMVGATELIENADYMILPQSDAFTVTLDAYLQGTRPYEAVIIGIGQYSGAFVRTVSYGIAKANVSDCTVVSESVVYIPDTQQSPVGRTKLVDANGNEIDPSEYTVTDLMNEDKDPKRYWDPVSQTEHFYDYVNCHGAEYKYDVVVTANDSSPNYTGVTTQAAFRIKWASIMPQLPVDDPEYDPALEERTVYGDIIWGDQSWNFIEALRDKTGNTVSIPYTGEPIEPTVESATYKGVELRPSFDSDYAYHPLDYDYKYLYGNPNPETDGGTTNDQINVTIDSPTCMTIRFTNGGNFENFVNVFFRIVPATLLDEMITVSDQVFLGIALKPKPEVIFNSKTLVEGTDYTLTYGDNNKEGTGTVIVTGKGNFGGTVTKSFNIIDGSSTSRGWVLEDGSWYYFDSNGMMQIGWLNLSGKYYYLADDGKMVTGWANIGGKWYFMENSGVWTSKSGWQSINGSWYYLNTNASPATGWLKSSNKWYYLDPEDGGAMVTGWTTYGSKKYFFNASGIMQTGWLSSGGNWYYLNDAAAVGWLKSGSSWYYMNSEGEMQTGWISAGGKKYYLKSSGIMQTGWLNSDGKWYYLNDAAAVGWLKSGSSWYYMNSEGEMQTSWITSGDKKYFLNASGIMQTGWVSIDKDWFFLNSDGSLKTGWHSSGNSWYYLDQIKDGAMAATSHYYTGISANASQAYSDFSTSGKWLGYSQTQ